MTDDLLAFLRARLDEDEEIAEQARRRSGSVRWMPVRIDDHIARHDPSRVLREVEAGRRLIDEFDKARAWLMTEENAVAKTAIAGMCTAWECAIQIRASVYSDHPDYRQDWA